MKHFTILLSLLFIVGITSAIPTEYLVGLSGDSKCIPVWEEEPLPTIIRGLDTLVVTEVAPPITTGVPDEYNPGSHNEACMTLMQHSESYHFTEYYIGCNNPECTPWFSVPLKGESHMGTREEFWNGLKNLSKKRAKTHIPPQYRDEPSVDPIWAPLRAGDILNLYIWGTGGTVEVNGWEVPCFFFAFEENCHQLGGDPLLPWELRAMLEAIVGQGQIHLNMAFAYCGAWEFWLGDMENLTVWYGAGATEYVYITDGSQGLDFFMWDGYSIEEFYFIEPVGHFAMCQKMRLTDADATYDPYRWDSNGDYKVMASEAAAEMNIYCHTSSSSRSGDDYRMYRYGDDEPYNGDNITVEISPNPFNPVAQIGFELPQAMRVKIVVFNILGQKVTTIIDGQLQAGVHRFKFDGSHLTSGTYFVRSALDGAVATQRMSLVK